MAPLVPLYGAGVMARRWLYDAGWLPAASPPLPTFCVGGLEAGGSGKTPVTAWLLAWLMTQGQRPGLLTRGYGRGREAPALAVREVGEHASPALLGDEAAMLVAGGLDVPVAAGPKRVRGAQALAGMGCSALVMDDGFAHRSLGRHLDVVVLHGDAPLGAGHLLPWGTLREPPSSLRRADVVWMHFKHGDVQKDGALPPALRRWCPQALVVHSRASYALEDAAGRAVELPEGSLVAASGVAHPEAYHRALKHSQVRIAQSVVFADHHRYNDADVERLRNVVTRCEAQGLVVTAKDAVKLRELWPSPQSLFILRSHLEITWGVNHFFARAKSVLEQ